MQPTTSEEIEADSMDIEAIVAEVQAGDKQAYQAILTHFERKMYTYCYYILKNHADTEDAVQEIFIRVPLNIFINTIGKHPSLPGSIKWLIII